VTVRRQIEIGKERKGQRLTGETGDEEEGEEEDGRVA
jgi:hypothetical protein